MKEIKNQIIDGALNQIKWQIIDIDLYIYNQIYTRVQAKTILKWALLIKW